MGGMRRRGIGGRGMRGPYGGGCRRFSRGRSGLDLRRLSRHDGDREFDTSLEGFDAGFS